MINKAFIGVARRLADSWTLDLADWTFVMTEPSLSPQDASKPLRLRDALRQARIEAADKTGVVVDLRDAEVARLEILNEALDPLFAEIPNPIDLFDRGISQGDPPRLWVDVIAHVQMGRDKRTYRFVQDTRFGRTVLAESTDVQTMVKSVADYIARRMVEREQALAAGLRPLSAGVAAVAKPRGKTWSFVLGIIVGMAALLLFAIIAGMRDY